MLYETSINQDWINIHGDQKFKIILLVYYNKIKICAMFSFIMI